ncbi:hypothetical protein C8A00DRAFT_13769 [Chaetomidium leptoderma]|uniref:Uncharacterized protein n=1 Tax=Chaetomidium leptoderma TaxID=669021 RepID=A0AAN6ZX37_9PEZI|nr:hypothetical protein C8A00DRAFT_13769 [Chaetomidium leptoderma]
MPRPRPKRSRVPAARPTKSASPASQEPQQSSATPPVVTKLTAAQAEFLGSDIYDVSDREKERIRHRAGEAAKAPAQPRRTRASQHRDLGSEQAKALEDSRRRRDDAMNRLDDLSSTSRPDHTDSPDIEHSRRESAADIQPRLTDASGLDLDDDFFGNLDDSLDDTESVVEGTQTGYRSTDTSSFNVAMFKRRPRQSSVAGRDDAPIRPSSRGQNTPSISTTLNFGNFRRRAREPSILGTARKPRTQRSLSRASQASRNASVLGDGDDSGPDGESTPLNTTRRQTRASLAASGSREGSPALPSRKRKSLESHKDGREKRPAVETEVEEGEADEAEEIHQSIEIEVERTPSPARGRARDRDHFSTPAQEDDPDMAPPLSSSSESNSPVAWPSLDTLAHRTYTRRAPTRAQKTPELDDECSSTVSSPPSLTHSPNYNAPTKIVPTKAKAPPPQKKVTTADLTSLLPRRRHHKAASRSNNNDSNDPFDLDGSDDEAGNDEEERPRAAARKRKGQQQQQQQQPLSKSTTSNRRKGKAAEAAGGTGGGNKKRTTRTYGSMHEDKEIDEVGDEIVVASGAEEEEEEQEQGEEFPVAETSQMMTERIGEELHKAVKKFKEVDKWELSFEEVAESSSPGPDAR